MSPSPKPSSSTPLARFSFVISRRYAPYTVVQALAALVDHTALAALAALSAGALGASAAAAGLELLLPGLTLLLPFLVLSGLGGHFADWLDKSLLIRRLKAAEVGIVAFAIVALLMPSVAALAAAVFALGVRAALFGPVKLAILPQHLGRDELLDGTALAVAVTVLAILVGAAVGSWLAPSPPRLTVVLAMATIVGWAASRAIPPAPSVDKGASLVTQQPAAPLLDRIGWHEVWRPLAVRNSVLGLSWFWALGAVLVALAPSALAERIAWPIAWALGSAGLLVGVLLAIVASRRSVELGLVPLGALGISLAGLAGWFALGSVSATATVGVMAALAGVGVAAGLYVVPLYGLLLTRVPTARLGRAVGANNIANASTMLVAALVASALLAVGVTPGAILLGAVVSNLLVAAWIFALVPEFLLRLLAWLLANVLYRLEVHGRDRIPAEGPVLIVCNHVSYVDAIILLGAIPRPTRFVMYWKIFDQPLLKWVFRAARAIPIAGRSENPALMEAAFASVRAELDAGEVVGIFPEGGLTRDGAIAPFRRGVERILATNPVPVVPMALRGLWGSLFSRQRRLRIPRRFRSPIVLVIGEPIPPERATAAFLEQRVRELRGDWA